ncbi:MAG TPA: RND transporter [Pirellulales bacterium]|nr:RND transporter [Pirellulales bacterium]
MNNFLKRAYTLLPVLLAAGCGPSASAPAAVTHDDSASASADEIEHQHAGWWCDEHGVPEEICGQCDSILAAEFQKKGDWCRDHDRPDSQCFECHPELEGKFAARYEAKYGKQPPKPAG